MNTLDHALSRVSPRSFANLPRATRLALSLLDRLEGGALVIELPDEQVVRVGHGPLVAHWRVRDDACFDAVLATGDIGLAEGWMSEAWDCDDLAALLGLLARNRDRLGAAVYGRFVSLFAHRVRHWLRANTRAGARRNIEAHYDLGNAFYALWLDPGMTYSAALFDRPDLSLDAAQSRKFERILDRLNPRRGETILEIGCGWGGFAELAAKRFGCKVLGLTLSPAQLAHARERALRGGYAHLVEFSLCDYRDVRGRYDHIVSIEMIEAVGERYWPAYFRRLHDLLEPGGRCVIQAITIRDTLFSRYRRGTDFIQRHVFPGGMLPSPMVMQRETAAAGLMMDEDFAFGADYARTLAIWHERFLSCLGQVRELGYPERFIRMWRFYLAYCEAGFAVGDLDVHHYVLSHRG